MTLIDSLFSPLYGKLCWDVRSGVGSALTFEFGEPHFEVVRQPYVSQSEKPWVIRLSKRRIVRIHGDWHLWIWACDWRFYRHDILIGDSEVSKKELQQIASDLEGQALLSVKATPAGISVFEFDLGGRLETQPYLEENDPPELYKQWYLYQPSGMVFTFRSDGTYNHSMGNKPSPDVWLPLEA